MDLVSACVCACVCVYSQEIFFFPLSLSQKKKANWPCETSCENICTPTCGY